MIHELEGRAKIGRKTDVYEGTSISRNNMNKIQGAPEAVFAKIDGTTTRAVPLWDVRIYPNS